MLWLQSSLGQKLAKPWLSTTVCERQWSVLRILQRSEKQLQSLLVHHEVSVWEHRVMPRKGTWPLAWISNKAQILHLKPSRAEVMTAYCHAAVRMHNCHKRGGILRLRIWVVLSHSCCRARSHNELKPLGKLGGGATGSIFSVCMKQSEVR